MKVGILAVGRVKPEILAEVEQGLVKVYPDFKCRVVAEALPVPEEALDKKRNQYNSSLILDRINVFAAGLLEFDRVLGLVDVDVFAVGLNYVFGEAYLSGRAGLVSLWRLRPEFYGERADLGVFGLRVLKEVVHELGHTLGLRHCLRELCVMHFSNSIFDTDRKQSLLCSQCYLQAALAISRLGKA